jgi:hypothetical protein
MINKEREDRIKYHDDHLDLLEVGFKNKAKGFIYFLSEINIIELIFDDI